MVYGIMPTQLGSISSPKKPNQQPGALFSLLIQVTSLRASPLKRERWTRWKHGSVTLSFNIFLHLMWKLSPPISLIFIMSPQIMIHLRKFIHIYSNTDKMTCVFMLGTLQSWCLVKSFRSIKGYSKIMEPTSTINQPSHQPCPLFTAKGASRSSHSRTKST